MFGSDKLHEREFYRFGSRSGRKPVLVWVGHIDEPTDLHQASVQPVVSCVVMSMREGMPRLSHAPFYLSALLEQPYEKIPPFDLSGLSFDRKYLEWRQDWDNGEGDAWDMGPAEVYYQAMTSLMERAKQ